MPPRGPPAFHFFLCNFNTFDVCFDYSVTFSAPTVKLASAAQGPAPLGADGALSGPAGLSTAAPPRPPRAQGFPGEFPGSLGMLPTQAGALRPRMEAAAGAKGAEPQGQLGQSCKVTELEGDRGAR